MFRLGFDLSEVWRKKNENAAARRFGIFGLILAVGPQRPRASATSDKHEGSRERGREGGTSVGEKGSNGREKPAR